MEKLLAELLKSQDNLSEIKFNFNDQDYVFYYRYITLLEKARIEQMCIKAHTKVKDDGSRETSYEKQEWVYPIHLILEKALDKKGERLFSHTNPKHFDIISKLPAQLATYIAVQMSEDILGTLKGDTNG